MHASYHEVPFTSHRCTLSSASLGSDSCEWATLSVAKERLLIDGHGCTLAPHFSHGLAAIPTPGLGTNAHSM